MKNRVKTYDPLFELKAVDENIWVVDGPIIHMNFPLGVKIPFPTRMVVIKLPSGGLFLWSPIEWNDDLEGQLKELGPVRHLVSPNKLHYAYIADYKKRFPEAHAWASPGVDDRALQQNIDTAFDRDLDDEVPGDWEGAIDRLVFRGSRFLEEVVFFHRPSRTLLLADLIENFEPDKVGRTLRPLIRLAGVADPDGRAPLDLRATFIGRHAEARRCRDRMLEWEPERVIMAHGRWYESNGTAEVERAFRWLDD